MRPPHAGTDAELDEFLGVVGRRGARALLRHHGTLPRDRVAELFAGSSIFLDMSHWQAWGRTGLEAMASGCVPVLPAGSGASEYAVHDVNAKLADTGNPNEAVTAIGDLVRDPDLLERLRTAALGTAGDFDLAGASLSILRLLCDHLDRRIARTLLMPSPCLTDDRLDLRYNTTEREARVNRTRNALRAASAARRAADLANEQKRKVEGQTQLLSKLERSKLAAARARRSSGWTR